MLCPIESALATTLKPASRYAATRPAPIPCEVPWRTETFVLTVSEIRFGLLNFYNIGDREKMCDSKSLLRERLPGGACFLKLLAARLKTAKALP